MSSTSGIGVETRHLPGQAAEAGSRSARDIGRTLGVAGSKLATVMARQEAWFVVGAAIVWLLARSWYALRPLWFDELFTFYLSRLPRLDQLFRALPADGNPPLYYLLARVSMHIFGESELALRLPALVGFLGAALAVYWYIRRWRAAIFAFLGMLLLLSGPMASYGSEARSYSLMLGFTGLALVSWQAAAARNRSRALPLLGVAAGIAGAVASHHYGAVQVAVALVFGESVRIFEQRRLDIPLYCAAAAGLSMLVFTLPLVAAARHVMLDYVKQSPVFWARPTLRAIFSYRSMLPLWFVPALLLLWLSTRVVDPPRETPATREACRIPAHEIAAAVGLALMVPIVIGLTSLTTGYYMDRYAIGAAMGIAILAGQLVPAIGRRSGQAGAVSALCVILLAADIAFHPVLASAFHGTAWRHAASATPDSLLSRAPGTDPIVIASALEYSQDWWYAPTPLRTRIHYLSDPAFAVREPDFLPEVSLAADQQYLPSKVDRFQEFVASHRHFLVYAVGMPRLEWTVPRLTAASWSLEPIGREGDFTLYRALAPAGTASTRR